MKKYLFGVSPLGPSRKVKAAVRKATGKINGGSDEARERFEKVLSSQSGANQENVLLCPSLTGLVYGTFRALKPARVLVIGPAVSDYRDAALSAGAAVDTFCTDAERQFVPDLGLLRAGAVRYDLLVLADPNRITGRALADDTLAELLVIARQQGSTLIVDEAFREFAGDQGCSGLAARQDNLIVLRTTAYYYGMPGLELAYAVSSPAIIRQLRKDGCGGLNLLAIEAARTAMKDRTYRRVSARFVEEERALLRRLLGRLPALRLYASDAHVLLIHAADRADVLVRVARQQGLAVFPCSAIDCLGSSYLAVSIMKHEHNLKLARIFKRVFAEPTERDTKPTD